MGEGLALLLLEDSAFDAELVQDALRTSHPGAQCTLVRDEAGFVHALATRRFDAVLSDYQVPGFGGDHALEIARAQAPQLPFIFVSGVIGEDNAVELLKRGATDYVSKGRLERLPLVLARALREVGERAARDAAEARLREADRLYARIVESLRDYAVLLLDAEHRITSWNRGAQAIFGFERAEAVGQSATLLLPAGEDAQEAWRRDLRLAATAQRATTQRWMLRRDGSRLWAEGVLMPLHGGGDGGGAVIGWCSITRDTTAEHLAAQMLREAKEQAEAARHEAERASLAKDRFIAMLSHELRAPLSAVSAAVHLLERHASVPAPHHDLVPMVRRNVAMEARLIDDLLDISAISSGKLGIKPEVVDMHAVLRDALAMLAEALAERGMQLELDLADRPAWVHADPVRMQQVVANLVRNAIKFSEPGGMVRLQTLLEHGEFVLACCDQGIGIAADALERIFTAFEQADRATARERGGLGLGLAIARHLALAHGGVLLADSPGLGQGARFTLRLPLREGAVPAPPAPPVAETERPRSARVLMVEDHPGAAMALRMCLEDYGYAVEHAASVAEALRLAQAQPFDLVLTDLGLPDGSGVEVGRALGAQLPVVALSGYGAESDLRSTAEAGFAGHLVKPVDPPQVHAVLQKLLARTTP